MFGGLGKSNVERQRGVLALLNDDRLTKEQKSAYCFDQGLCDGCGIKTHWLGPFKRRPYTNERVYNGICRSCHPEEAANDTKESSAKQWGLVVPPEVLLAKTSDAFSSLQSSVSEGIHNINETVNSEQAKQFRRETARTLDNVSSSVSVGINQLNDNIKKNTENIDTTRALNNFQSSVTEGFNKVKSQTIQRKPSDEPKTALSSLKTNFKTNSQELKATNSNDCELSLQEENGTTATAPENLKGKVVKGKVVKTPFGKGRVEDYRSEDEIFVVHLHHNNRTEDGKPHPANNTKLFCKRESFQIEDEKNKTRQKQSMELNEAYESLEKMRRLNLELECQERGIVGHIDFNKCTMCLLKPDQESSQQRPQSFRRIRNLMDNKKKKAATPCLFCAAPMCADHACPAFRKEGITACLECVKLFESEYIVACINHAHGLSAEKAIQEEAGLAEERPLDHMMDLYDRVLLLLQYSSQYIESIAVALEQNTKKGNVVNVSASSVGIVSGALGVAAAAAIFTPAGPPLLVASLMLGGGATAAQTGTEVVNYFSEPNKFADKIIALTGMIHSLLRVKEQLREILTARLMAQQGNPEIERLKNSLDNLRKKQKKAAVVAGTTVASTAVLGGVAGAAASAAAVESAALVSTAEVGVLAGRNANMLSKSGTAIARGARFARFAGGALSAATIVLEAKTMHNTVEQIRAGHPCEKANALRTILKEIPTLPTTEQLDDECRVYVGAMSNRVNATSLEDAINMIESKAIQEWQVTKANIQETEGDMAPEGASIVDGDTFYDDQSSAWESVTGALSASLSVPAVDADSDAAPPVPKMVQTQSSPMASSQSNLATRATPPARMTQSMSALPSEPVGPSDQSALLERIKKFKQEESFGSTGSTHHDGEDFFDSKSG